MGRVGSVDTGVDAGAEAAAVGAELGAAFWPLVDVPSQRMGAVSPAAGGVMTTGEGSCDEGRSNTGPADTVPSGPGEAGEGAGASAYDRPGAGVSTQFHSSHGAAAVWSGAAPGGGLPTESFMVSIVPRERRIAHVYPRARSAGQSLARPARRSAGPGGWE